MRFQILTFLIILLAGSALASPDKETVVREGVIDEDIYLAGERVMVDADAKGDVVIGAANINVDGTVAGDLIAAGAEVTVNAQLGDDVRLIGGQISLCSSVAGDLVLAGADINVCDEAEILKNSFIAGQDLTLEGKYGGNLVAKGERITLAGEVTGNVNFEAKNIELLPGSSVGGNLEYKSPNPARIHEGAVIGGEEIYSIAKSSWWNTSTPDTGSILGFVITLLIVGVIGISIAALVLAYFFPYLLNRTTSIVQTRLFPSMGIGLVVTLVTPIIALLLLVTIIGAPLAALLFVAFLLTLIIGFYTSLLCIADAIASLLRKSKPMSKFWRFFTVILAALAVVLIGVIPVLGGITVFLIYLTGAGAVFTYLQESRQTGALL